MLNNDIIFKVITKLVAPFVLLFALYIQVCGEDSPGGGFQAGALFASGIIALEMVIPELRGFRTVKNTTLAKLAIFGFAVYFLVGLIPLIKGYNYLNYYGLLDYSKVLAQKIGIMVIELGVGMAVFAVLLLLYLEFIKN